jgi:hypothetical protein
MLVQRWAILRTAMPKGVTIKKVIALVNALMKLHNFCIDVQGELAVDAGNKTINESTVRDTDRMMNNVDGFVSMETVGDEHNPNVNLVLPRQLIDGGNHFDEIPRHQRTYVRASMADHLPRKALHDKVLNSHKVRPASNRRMVTL